MSLLESGQKRNGFPRPIQIIYPKPKLGKKKSKQEVKYTYEILSIMVLFLKRKFKPAFLGDFFYYFKSVIFKTIFKCKNMTKICIIW